MADFDRNRYKFRAQDSYPYTTSMRTDYDFIYKFIKAGDFASAKKRVFYCSEAFSDFYKDEETLKHCLDLMRGLDEGNRLFIKDTYIKFIKSSRDYFTMILDDIEPHVNGQVVEIRKFLDTHLKDVQELDLEPIEAESKEKCEIF